MTPSVSSVPLEHSTSMHSMKYLEAETPRRQKLTKTKPNHLEKPMYTQNFDTETGMRKAYINIMGENLQISNNRNAWQSNKSWHCPPGSLGSDKMTPGQKVRRLRSAPLVSLMRHEQKAAIFAVNDFT